MLAKIPRPTFKLPVTSGSRLPTANSPYQQCGIPHELWGTTAQARISDAEYLVAVEGSGLSFLRMVESLVTQLEKVAILFLSYFCFDLLDYFYD